MLEITYRLFEMLALVVCLHSLNGEKLKIDVYNVGFVGIEMAFMQMIQEGIVSKGMYFVIYLMYFIYAYLKFGDSVKRTVLKCLLVMIIIVLLQMMIYTPLSFLYYFIPSESIISILINFITFVILYVSRKNKKYKNIVEVCARKDWILRGCLIICVFIIGYCMFSLKMSSIIDKDIFILISLLMIMLAVFLYRWQKSSFEVERKEREIEMTNLYNGVFEELVQTIRKRQHDFQNQIDAVYSLHLTADSLESLVEAQKKYCDKLIYENRYSKVLSCSNNSTLSGFIYTKFMRAESVGVKVEYDIAFEGKSDISMYDLIDILGILLDNAIEAVKDSNGLNKIKFQLIEGEQLEICVKNPVEDISNNDIEKFYREGYSTKGDNRGLGLSKIKEYQKKYNYDIFTHLINEVEEKWIEFRIVFVNQNNTH